MVYNIRSSLHKHVMFDRMLWNMCLCILYPWSLSGKNGQLMIIFPLFKRIFVVKHDDPCLDSYISTIGVDFVSIRILHSTLFLCYFENKYVTNCLPHIITKEKKCLPHICSILQKIRIVMQYRKTIKVQIESYFFFCFLFITCVLSIFPPVMTYFFNNTFIFGVNR